MITVFGSINMDLIASTVRLPKPGETVTGTGFSTAAGGKGANQALAARRAGAEVRMVGAVGGDNFAAPALALLSEAGTDLSNVAHVADPTGTAMILVGGDGENMIAVVAGANGTVDEVAAVSTVAAMKDRDILMLQMEIPSSAIHRALLDANARGITTIVNTAPLTHEAALLGRMAAIVIANETEFEMLASQQGMDDTAREAAMQRIFRETGQSLIVTLGAEGVIALREGKIYRAKGLDIQPVDTVGAGDTFCGFFAASLDQGLNFEQALRRAAVAGSLACLKPGAQPSIPLASEVEAKL